MNSSGGTHDIALKFSEREHDEETGEITEHHSHVYWFVPGPSFGIEQSRLRPTRYLHKRHEGAVAPTSIEIVYDGVEIVECVSYTDDIDWTDLPDEVVISAIEQYGELAVRGCQHDGRELPTEPYRCAECEYEWRSIPTKRCPVCGHTGVWTLGPNADPVENEVTTKVLLDTIHREPIHEEADT